MAVAVDVRRRQMRLGPALRLGRFPFASVTVSALLHAALIVLGVVVVNALKEPPTQTYIVNLVPSLPAIGTPQGTVSTPGPPTPPPPEPAARSEPTPDLPARPARIPDLPARTSARELPSRSRSLPALPERTLPSRTTTTPKPEQKELPAVARSTPNPAPPSSTSTPTATRASSAVASASPPASLGLPTGAIQGHGALAQADGNFPYAWYLQALMRKISEQWDQKALPGNQPAVVFEITRDGHVNLSRIQIEKTSGNPLYDQVAFRAIAESAPFPPLPDGFSGQFFRVHIQFQYSRG